MSGAARGRKPCMASVLSVGLLSRLMGHAGPVAAAELAASLGQMDLAAIGSWNNNVTGRHEPVSGSTLHRIMQTLDPEQRQAMLQRHGQPRLHIAQAVAVDASRATPQDRLARTTVTGCSNAITLSGMSPSKKTIGPPAPDTHRPTIPSSTPSRSP